jgi:hypothetical protein
MDLEQIKQEISEIEAEICSVKDFLTKLNQRKERLIILLYEEQQYENSLTNKPSLLSVIGEAAISPASPTTALEKLRSSADSDFARSSDCSKNPIAAIEESRLLSSSQENNNTATMLAIASLVKDRQLKSFSTNFISVTLDVSRAEALGGLKAGCDRGDWKAAEGGEEKWISSISIKRKKRNYANPLANFPDNSRNGLVETSDSYLDLLSKVFDLNQERPLRSKDIFTYLYPDPNTKLSQKKVAEVRQYISRSLWQYAGKDSSNWEKISLGLYNFVDKK